MQKTISIRRAVLVSLSVAFVFICIYAGGDNSLLNPGFINALNITPNKDQNEEQKNNPSKAINKACLGINIHSISYYSRQIPFVDVMKSCMPWVTQNYNKEPGEHDTWNTELIHKITQDENGYPLELPFTIKGVKKPQIVATLMMVNTEGHYPKGLYTVLYEGTGKFYFTLDARVIHENPGKIILQVTPTNNGILMKILNSKKGNHVRNIRIIMPGYETTYNKQIFYPPFMHRIQNLDVLRFMDATKTNNNPLKTWTQRTIPTFYTQTTESGIALEYLIELVNRMQKDIWITIPHMADDEYVRNCAHMLKNNLNKERWVYLEYSNELWNSLFPQARFVQDIGCRLNLYENCYDTKQDAQDTFWAGIYYQAKRSAEIFKIFEEEFGNDQRIVKILSGQASNPHVQEVLLKAFYTSTINPSYIKADALSIACYFGGDVANQIVKMGVTDTISIDTILDMAENSMDSLQEIILRNKAIANSHNLSLFAYEGGQHLVTTGQYINNQSLTEKLNEANRHIRMKKLYEHMFDIWFNAGGDLLMVYSYITQYGKYGSWGILEYQDQEITDAPKYQGVLSYAPKKKTPAKE